jgi:hypothetical protein
MEEGKPHISYKGIHIKESKPDRAWHRGRSGQNDDSGGNLRGHNSPVTDKKTIDLICEIVINTGNALCMAMSEIVLRMKHKKEGQQANQPSIYLLMCLAECEKT